MMVMTKTAVSGTLESSDAFVSVEPAAAGLEIKVESVVLRQFGRQIEQSIREVCAELGVDAAKLYINDRGALDCTIRARVEAALRRAGEVDA